jgi:S-adenosylmethionine-diacylgycerolhomoserine-N-methlytransferase
VTQAERGDRMAHGDFLDNYYGISRHFYDFTRKYYLLGRDEVLRSLAREPIRTLVEVGAGTGRNLRQLQSLRPDLLLGGLDASTAMLEVARERCPAALFKHGFAEDTPLDGVLGCSPERVLFSYSLSMVQEPETALDSAIASLPPGGQVVVIDFGDFAGLPRIFARTMIDWLALFHVQPVRPEMLRARGAQVTWGPGRYYLVAHLTGPGSQSHRQLA